MKKILLVFLLAFPMIMLGQNPGVSKWEDTWGVRYWFQVGSPTGSAAFIVKPDSSRFSKPVKFDKAISLGRVADATSLISVNGLAGHANLLKISNEDGTARATLDSAGNLTVAGTVGSGAFTGTGTTTLQILNIGAGQNTELHPLTIRQYSGTEVITADTTGLLSARSIAVGIGQNTKLNTFVIEDFDGTDKILGDSTGLLTSIGLTTTGAITATSQTIASGAITSTGTSSFHIANIGSGQNTELHPLTVRMYGGTEVTTFDTTGLGSLRSLSLGTGQTTKLITFTVEDYDGTDITTIDTTGVVLTADGSAAAPTYSFTSSTGTGMYRSASNVLGFATAGSERVLIDAAGRLDVGNTSQTSSKFAVRNSTTEVNLALLENEDGTEKYRIDSTGTPYSATIATGVDSFSTTAAIDSVTLSDSYGFTTSSKVSLTQWNPAWSTELDTVVITGQIVITGQSLTKLVVTRAKTHVTGASAVKSGMQYYYKVER